MRVRIDQAWENDNVRSGIDPFDRRWTLSATKIVETAYFGDSTFMNNDRSFGMGPDGTHLGGINYESSNPKRLIVLHKAEL
jgi:hypothetical protein